jgi:uncharacterized protein YjiS (DUF1127 family)
MKTATGFKCRHAGDESGATAQQKSKCLEQAMSLQQRNFIGTVGIPTESHFDTSFGLAAGSTALRAYTQFESGIDRLRLGAIFSLPATWWQRACFRAELRADLRSRPDFLRDIGIGLLEAQAEASRFFWEPLLPINQPR